MTFVGTAAYRGVAIARSALPTRVVAPALARDVEIARLEAAAAARRLPAGSLASLDARDRAFAAVARELGTRRDAAAVAAATPGLPELDALTGALPAGIHAAPWADVVARFGGASLPGSEGAVRTGMTMQLACALRLLRQGGGVGHVALGGSFVTRKARPRDVDIAYLHGRSPAAVESTLATLARTAPDRARPPLSFTDAHQPLTVVARAAGWGVRGETMLEFFRHDRLGRQVGVVLVPLDTVR